MNNLKFRIYVKRLKKMVYFNLFSLDRGFLPEELVYIDDKEESSAVMQYTGSKDKNDKEIYESDIIKIGLELGTTNLVIREVKFHQICTQFGVLDLNSQYTDLNYSNKKVIGNIYENPELLEGV